MPPDPIAVGVEVGPQEAQAPAALAGGAQREQQRHGNERARNAPQPAPEQHRQEHEDRIDAQARPMISGLMKLLSTK